MKIGIIIFAVSLLIALWLLTPIKLELEYIRNESENKTCVLVRYIFLKFCFPKKENDTHTDKSVKERETKPTSFDTKKERLTKYINIFETVKPDAARLLKYITSRAAVFEKIEFASEYGFDNAMHTGIFSGLLNGFVYSVLGFIHHNSTLRGMAVKITPIFDKPCFNIRAKCILHVKTAHIIIIAVNVLKILRKIKKTEGSK